MAKAHDPLWISDPEAYRKQQAEKTAHELLVAKAGKCNAEAELLCAKSALEDLLKKHKEGRTNQKIIERDLSGLIEDINLFFEAA